jgi:molecular chaperone HscB
MDPFATFGFARRYDLNQGDLERRYRDLQQALHPDKHSAAPASQRQMNLLKAVEVNEAYRVLRDDAKRAEALLAALGGKQPQTEHEQADPELLMEMMELREALSDAREVRNAAQIAQLADQVKARESHVRARIADAFAALTAAPASESSGSPEAFSAVRELLSRLRYYRRFLDEVVIFEDEALSEQQDGSS